MKRTCITALVATTVILICGISIVYPVIPFGLSTFANVKADASSTLKEKDKPDNFYLPSKAADGNPATAWCQGGKKSGIGEYIDITFRPVLTNAFHVLNGYGASKSLYLANNRIKEFEATVTFIDGSTRITRGVLKDGNCLPGFDVDPSGNHPCRFKVDPDFDDQPNVLVSFGDSLKCVKGIRIKILSVYPGSRFSDTCIAEVGHIQSDEWEESPGGYPDYRKQKKECCGGGK